MRRLFPVVAISLLLCACSTNPAEMANTLNPFKIDIRQGNYVSQDMVVQLKPGQTKDQVRYILGTPLVMDVFHADRWDYVYRFKPGRGPVEQRRLIVYFQDNRLVRVGGDVVAGEAGEIPAKPPMQTLEIEGPKVKSAPKVEEAPTAQLGGASSSTAAQ
jgi:outer membrane protein assembly factor BamE